jgi:hypothetical protein
MPVEPCAGQSRAGAPPVAAVIAAAHARLQAGIVTALLAHPARAGADRRVP